MPAKIKGADALAGVLSNFPRFITNTACGAIRAGAVVMAEDAKRRLGSRRAEVAGGATVLIADAVKVTARAEVGLVTAKIELKGPGAYVGPWLEYGTDPHFISVDPAISGGRTARRVNKLTRDGNSDVAKTLVIAGKPVGKTVYHDGARDFPFMRPARETQEGAMITAVGQYFVARLTKAGLAAPAVIVEEDE